MHFLNEIYFRNKTYLHEFFIVIHIYVSKVAQITNIDEQLDVSGVNWVALRAAGRKNATMQIVDESLRSNIIVGFTIEKDEQHIRMIACDFFGQQLGQNVCGTDQCGSR